VYSEEIRTFETKISKTMSYEKDSKYYSWYPWVCGSKETPLRKNNKDLGCIQFNTVL
jgi:hypothetical protein